MALKEYALTWQHICAHRHGSWLSILSHVVAIYTNFCLLFFCHSIFLLWSEHRDWPPHGILPLILKLLSRFEDQWQRVYLGASNKQHTPLVNCWARFCLKSSLMTWVVRQRVASEYLLMTQNKEEWLMLQIIRLTSRGILTGWRNRWTEMPQGLTSWSAEFCTWGVNIQSAIPWGSPGCKAAFQKRAWIVLD